MKKLALALAAAAIVATAVPLTAANAAPATERALTNDVTDVSSSHRHHWRHHHAFWHRKHVRHYGWYRGHHYGWRRHYGPYMHHYGWYRGHRW